MTIDEKIKELEYKHHIILRPQQVKIIKFVLFHWLNGQKNVFVEGPTGVGKSAIAFFVSEIMNSRGQEGYILTSDISLQNQYADSADEFSFYRPNVKGIDNYICTENGKVHSQGTCHVKNYKSFKIKSLNCYSSCPYYSARNAAAEANTAILNYNYYLLMQNYVKRQMEEAALFRSREFVIYDEAHKILDIVQENYAPRINREIFKTIENYQNSINKSDIFSIEVNFKDDIFSIFKELRLTADKNKTLEILIELKLKLIEIKEINLRISEWISEQVDRQNYSVFDNIDLLKQAKFIDDFFCKIEDYIELIQTTSLETMFINANESETKYNFINEHFLIKKNLLDHSNLNLFMSATLGKDFPRMLGCTDFAYLELESDFDFRKSPIFVYKDFYVNYRNKSQMFPRMVKKLDQILDKNIKYNGIIHTASYENTNFIKMLTNNPSRIIDYENAKEKEYVLDMLGTSNKIVMGPTLIEGIDLPDELSRLQILFKIPFPSLGDKFINYKFIKNPDWYNWATRIKIQQALGRSIRHKDDYAITYILDSNFIKMIDSFPNYIKKRIKIL